MDKSRLLQIHYYDILDNDIIKDFWPIGAVALAFLLLIIINQIKKH